MGMKLKKKDILKKWFIVYMNSKVLEGIISYLLVVLIMVILSLLIVKDNKLWL